MVKPNILITGNQKERISNINPQDLGKAIDLIADIVIRKMEKPSFSTDKKETAHGY